jgi:hypothetical protein
MTGVFKKKWLIVLSAFAALCLAAVATVCVVLFWGASRVVDHFLPAYSTQQIPSTHPGYRRTTLLSGSSAYVNDYEEYSLRLINPEPTQVIGRYGAGKVCAIPDQNPTNYIAADCGSEMPAYEVFRNSQTQPFDWRKATFQQMQFTGPSGSGVNILTTNQTLITDVIRTLRDGTPATTTLTLSTNASNFAEICLFSDQLPGLIFCPAVYLDPSGQVFLAESTAYVPTGSPSQNQSTWKSASREFTDWIHSH